VAVDPDGRLWVTDYSLGTLSSVDTATGVVGATFSAGWAANGVAVTADGNIWVATVAAVNRFNAFGPVFTLDTFIQPSGVAVDGAGNVWVVGTGSSTVLRVNSTFNQVDLQKDVLSSGGHETAGDLAGTAARNVTTRYGTWSVVRDSGLTNTSWGTITWQGTEPDGTRLTVRARSSHDQEAWSGWETAVSGVALSTIPGRYSRSRWRCRSRAAPPRRPSRS
jgi:streptogramin lyase